MLKRKEGKRASVKSCDTSLIFAARAVLPFERRKGWETVQIIWGKGEALPHLKKVVKNSTVIKGAKAR